MAQNNYSEDYEKILVYKQNLLSEDFSRIKEYTVDFFFEKYKDLINNQYDFLYRISSQGPSFEGNLDYEETSAFSIEIMPQEYFEEKIKEKYIPQALDNFNPEIIRNKKNYCFATYMYNYFRHAVRDLPGSWRKNMSNLVGTDNTESIEEKIINEAESARIRKKIAALKNELNPLESQILDFLVEGKKQKEMIMINDETGKPYTKGYISKLVKKIRSKMSRLLEEK
ncbi:MAG: hypothetical protein IIT58_08240 [Treponema sp.]|nr:hypothetical protein [Treponema sp.]